MKTLQELYKEIIASEELKTAFVEAAKAGKTVEFLKAQGCEATTEELAVFLKKQTSGELSDEELDNVAGGGCNDETERETIYSCLSLGVYCAGAALSSAIDGYAGQKRDCDGRLCTHEGKMEKFVKSLYK